MKNKLIKLLGGFTSQELQKFEDDCQLRIEINNSQIEARHETILVEISFYQKAIAARDEEVKRLTNLMLTRAGFLSSISSPKTEEKHLKPINSRKNWPQLQKELELADAKKQADEVESRWKAKNASMPQGTLADEEIQRDIAELAG